MTGTDTMVPVMCGGDWTLGANGTSIKGGKTDLERSPPPGLCKREKIWPVKPQLYCEIEILK